MWGKKASQVKIHTASNSTFTCHITPDKVPPNSAVMATLTVPGGSGGDDNSMVVSCRGIAPRCRVHSTRVLSACFSNIRVVVGVDTSVSQEAHRGWRSAPARPATAPTTLCFTWVGRILSACAIPRFALGACLGQNGCPITGCIRSSHTWQQHTPVHKLVK